VGAEQTLLRRPSEQEFDRATSAWWADMSGDRESAPTSADAERPYSYLHVRTASSVYLRVSGADAENLFQTPTANGLPPLVRSIPVHHPIPNTGNRPTSTDVAT
jgi:hypothetical protein